MNGGVTGSLCEPLCVRQEVKYVRCLGHGVKLHVLQAQWGPNTIVLKIPSPINNKTVADHIDWHRDRSRTISREEFIRDVRLQTAHDQPIVLLSSK